MKKLFLSTVTASLLFLSIQSFAQISVGPKVGLNISKIYFNTKDAETDTPDFNRKIGFQIGGILNAQINEYFSIRPELLFNNIGGIIKDDDLKRTFNLNYLTLPINFVGQYPISDKFKLQGFFGPYAALGLGGKIKVEITDPSNPQSETIDVKMKKDPSDFNDHNTYLNAWDFGLNFGLGFQYTSFVFTANYGLGLTSIEPHYKNSDYESTRGDDGKIYNRNITFGVAYLFGGKK